MTTIPRCPRPTEPGTYICQRVYFNDNPALAEIHNEKGVLIFRSKITIIPLSRLETSAIFWGPLTLSVDPHPAPA